MEEKILFYLGRLLGILPKFISGRRSPTGPKNMGYPSRFGATRVSPAILEMNHADVTTLETAWDVKKNQFEEACLEGREGQGRELGGDKVHSYCEGEVLPPPAVKEAKTPATSSTPATKGARPLVALGEGTSTKPGAILGPRASMLGNASMAEKILARQAVVLGSSLVVRKLEGLLAQFSDGEKKADEDIKETINVVARLEGEVAELKKNQALAKKKAVEEYKALEAFHDAVESAASKYFSEGFNFCKSNYLTTTQTLASTWMP
ncbi:hypothetical protein Acr_00g0077850 [Actinidia rufa]|uniref:Uncharacterized protein n=1 Tax=Actinidia rufa TaxID=165716 RepID=A0A7J0DV70_9ERIC|nr:hypothetical protein Acr_00g0077850 [Actinidia rufa]